MSDDPLLKKPHSIRQLALGMMAYSSASIFGPLVVFIVLGFFLDKYFDTKPIFLLGGVVFAFVFTNTLLYKKVKILNKRFKELDEEKKKTLLNRKLDI